MDDWVLVDTCIWASFFSKPNSAEKRIVDSLIDTDRVTVTGAILAEVLIGFRRKDQADWIASRMRMAHFMDATWDDWRAAAEIGRQLAAQGDQLPLTDLLIAAVALRINAFVYTSDPHFDLIEGLKRFSA